MPEQFAANGQSLQTAWCQVEDITPAYVTPPKRGENVPVPGRHGRIRTRYKRYDVADLVLPLRVLGLDPVTGTLPVDPLTQLHDNVDELLRLFGGETVLLEHERADGLARQALTELAMEPVAVTRERSHPPMARLAVPLTLFEAFWEDAAAVSQSVSGPTGTVQPLTVFVGATAPCSDLLITFFGPVNNPQIQLGDTDVWVRYNGVLAAGQQVVLDTSTWQVSPGTGTPWSPDVRQVSFGRPGVWFELDPAVTPFAVRFTHTAGGSASASIAGPRKYLSL